MSQKGLLFDLDGTLLNSLTDIGLAANRTLEKYYLPTLDISDYRYLVGRGAEYLVRRCLPTDKATEEFVLEFLNEFLNDYNENFETHSVLYPGVAETLDWIETRGIKKSILSNKLDMTTKACVGRFLKQWSFDFTWGSGRGYPKKPDPTAALEIARRMGIPAHQFLYLGDTNIDMKTAKAAGMRAIGVSWGFRPESELIESGAEVVISEPSRLIDLIKKDSP